MRGIVNFMTGWMRFFSWRKHGLVFMRLNKVKSVSGQVCMSQLTIIGIMGWNMRLHHFYLPDDPDHWHTHPRGFISICLRGSYHEEMMNGSERGVTPGTLTIRKATDGHRVTPTKLPCTTFVLTTPVIRKWDKIEK